MSMKMNQTINRCLLIGLMAGITTACTDNFEKYNTNPYNATDQEMGYDGYKMRSALTNMQGWVIPLEEHSCQFIDCLLGGSYGGYLADSNNGFNGKNFATYTPEETWLKVLFTDIIPKIYPSLKDLKASTTDPVPLAVGEVIKVIAMLRVTDAYGPIPYSKIGEDGKLETPYDSQEQVYTKMFEELDAAIATLTANRTNDFTANADMVYGGKAEKWVKLANSIKLRMAIRIADVSPTLAQQKAQEAATHEIGTMTVNEDNAFMTVAVTNPFRKVMYEFNEGDSRISADITSYMNGYEDPRCSKYFTLSAFTKDEFQGKPITENGYYGLRSGIQIPGNVVKHYTNMNVQDNSKILWMNAAECAFLKAEGAMRGWNMGAPTGGAASSAAEGFYNMGIRLSFAQWGADGADTYLANETLKPQVYEDPMGSFNYDKATSVITIKWKNVSGMDPENLERIITQKWIANFPLGLEAWSEYRRTGYPHLMEVMVNNSGGTVDSERMARRLYYPQSERTNNTANLNDAISKYLNGPDNMGTDVWWAKKN